MTLSRERSIVRRFALALLLATGAGTAHADAFYKLVGYRCDRPADRLLLTYRAAANDAGEALYAAKGPDEWDPWNLITMRDDEHIATTITIRRSCALSDGVYAVELGPIPGNMNTVGHCGAWISAWAEVRRGADVIYPRTDFETGVGCFYADGEITTEVEIRPGRARHAIKRSPAVDLLGDTPPPR